MRVFANSHACVCVCVCDFEPVSMYVSPGVPAGARRLFAFVSLKEPAEGK